MLNASTLPPAAPLHREPAHACVTRRTLPRARRTMVTDLFGAMPQQIVESQAALDLAPDSAEALGWALGRDHARHGLQPPADLCGPDTAVGRGWQASRLQFGGRTLAARPAVQAWLRLRLAAWRRGQAVEDVQLTADFLRRITVPQCPVTREALAPLGASPPVKPAANETASVVVRLRPEVAWAAGHLALLSERAAAAMDAPGSAEAHLGEAAALRLRVLRSFVMPLSHEAAAALPLVVLPPPRVRLLNPAQALAAMITLQFAAPLWSQRLSRIEALVPGTALRRDFNLFVHALIPRVLEAGTAAAPHRARQALEDAWHHPLVQRRWQRLALGLGREATEALVQRIARRRLVPGSVQWHTAQQAVDGWAAAA